jgi:two-component system response regulator PhoP
MRVLVIEDEPQIRSQLVDRLQATGYVVDASGDGEEGLYFGNEYPIDIAIVDLGLPKIAGIDIVRRWRQADRRFPILILTARGRWQDKVQGLEAGADDYLVKPFEMEELLARVRALIRRSSGWAEPVLTSGPILLDTSSQTVKVNGTAVDLTAYEYRLLEYLMLHAGEVVSKSELTDHLYAEDDDRDSNVLEVLVARLRRKLDPDRSYGPIQTLRGRGYLVRLDADE